MCFHSWVIKIMMVAMFGTFFLLGDAKLNATFDENYKVTWGSDHVLYLNEGREVRLLLDEYSAGGLIGNNLSIATGDRGAGFTSKAYFGSGFFKMKIKLPANDSGGLLYRNENGVHDELDFEFLGNRPGKPIEVQTNIFTNGVGNREQRIKLWFDPAGDFHYYKILWNHHQIVFFVDNIPIRVFKNNIIRGVGYPNSTMQVVVSLWDGSDWATDGGQVKADYTHGPFEAYFQDFNINGCHSSPSMPNIKCLSQDYRWNSKTYWILKSNQQKAYELIKKKRMIYDYCTDGIGMRRPNDYKECH